MTDSEKTPATGVFISYRRDDNSRWARRLAPQLRERVGEGRVALDIDFDPGRDWREQIDERLATASIVVVLIGPDFLSLRDAAGRPRIEGEGDQVRHEIRTALSGDKAIMPVLTDRAAPLEAIRLPADIRPLAYLQAGRLDNTEDLDAVCDRIERRLMHGDGQGGPRPGATGGRFAGGRQTPLFRDPAAIRSQRTAALQELIGAGWLVDDAGGDMVAVNGRHAGYRFRFDRREPWVWLEEDAAGDPRSPRWRRVQSFPLSADAMPKRSAGLEVPALASAATNPAAFLGRTGRVTFDGAGAAIGRALHRPPVPPGRLRELIEANRIQTSTAAEQRARAAEGRRRAARGIDVVFAHDIDLGVNRVTGIAFGRSSDTLAIACDMSLFLVDATAAAITDPAALECEASVTCLRWADRVLALGLANGDVVLLDPANGATRHAPPLDAAWRRLTVDQQLAHAVDGLDVRADARLLVYSCAQIPLALWRPDQDRVVEVALPRRSGTRDTRGRDLGDLWDDLRESVGERFADWAGAGCKGIYRVTLDSRGAAAVCDQWGDEILVFDPRRPGGGRSIQTRHGVNDLMFSPDGQLLATAGGEARVELIPVERPEDRRELAAHEPIADHGAGYNDTLGVAFSPDGRFLASIGEDRNVIIWRTADGAPCAVIELSWHGPLPRRGPWLAWSRDGNRLAVPWEGSRVRIVRLGGT